jgi:hypothetical protein
MADGDNVILGQENDADSETQIHSTGADTRFSALFVLNDNGRAIQGTGGFNFPGVSGFSENASGVRGTSTNGFGVFATSNSGDGVAGSSFFGTGVTGNGGQFGVRGRSDNAGSVGVQGTSSHGLAGRFFGDVQVQGTLTKSAGAFKIDHPLDPENKYLFHAFVESPDMLNIYNGNITTDDNGDATVILPDYFDSLNQDFRYQLTVIGKFAQAIVAEEVSGNQFAIKTDQPNVRVSWQVTGIRKDHFANMHRIQVEEDKPVNERGLYLHPEAHSKPETQGIRHQDENRHLHERQLWNK